MEKFKEQLIIKVKDRSFLIKSLKYVVKTCTEIGISTSYTPTFNEFIIFYIDLKKALEYNSTENEFILSLNNRLPDLKNEKIHNVDPAPFVLGMFKLIFMLLIFPLFIYEVLEERKAFKKVKYDAEIVKESIIAVLYEMGELNQQGFSFEL